MKKIRAAVIGYGNIGKYALEALKAADDFEIAGVVRRNAVSGNVAQCIVSAKSSASGIQNEPFSFSPAELSGIRIAGNVRELENVDVAILATPSRKVEEYALDCLAAGINTVDSFDIHTGICDLRTRLDSAAKAAGKASIISAGWDPGTDSIVRALLQAMAPKGLTYTNFGPGMSMGHTVAVKAIEGVSSALSMTIPVGTGLHRRMVYVELKEGYSFEAIEAAIKADPYFVHDETHVIQVPSVDSLKDMGHGVNLTRKGVSGSTQNQRFEFNMSINNPALTGQILVCAARAVVKRTPGAYTMIEIPVIDLLPGDRDALIRSLV